MHLSLTRCLMCLGILLESIPEMQSANEFRLKLANRISQV